MSVDVETPAIERRGSARRALWGYVSTVAAGMPLGVVLLWVCATHLQNVSWDFLPLFIYGLIALSIGFWVIAPLLAFTVGRWLDQSGAKWARFGAVGLIVGAAVFALAVAAEWSVAAALSFPVIGFVSCAGGFLLFEAARQHVVWRRIAVVFFVVSLAPPVYLAWIVVTHGGIGFAA